MRHFPRIFLILVLAVIVSAGAAAAESGTTRWQVGKSVLELPAQWPLSLSEDGKKLEGGGILIVDVDVLAGGVSSMLDGLSDGIRRQMILSGDESRYNSTDHFTAENGAFGTYFTYQSVPCAHIINGSGSVLVGVQGGAYEPKQVFDAVAQGLSGDEAAIIAGKTHTVQDFAVQEPSGWLYLRVSPIHGGLEFAGNGCSVSFTVQSLDFTGDPHALRDRMMSNQPIMQRLDTASGIPGVYYLDTASSCFTVMLFDDDSVGVIVVTGDDSSKWEAAGRTLADCVTVIG